MPRLIAIAVVSCIVAVGFVVVTAPTPAPAQSVPSRCTRVGTPARDVMRGTRRPEVFCVIGGNDYVHAGGGRDSVLAGSGPDTIIGGNRQDKLRGGAGNDRIFAVDGHGGDKVFGGPGLDRCYIDQGDSTEGCHEIIGINERLVRALDRVIFQAFGIIENLPTPTTTVTVTLPAPVTTTVTRTVPFPPCTPPPDAVPNPCG